MDGGHEKSMTVNGSVVGRRCSGPYTGVATRMVDTMRGAVGGLFVHASKSMKATLAPSEPNRSRARSGFRLTTVTGTSRSSRASTAFRPMSPEPSTTQPASPPLAIIASRERVARLSIEAVVFVNPRCFRTRRLAHTTCSRTPSNSPSACADWRWCSMAERTCPSTCNSPSTKASSPLATMTRCSQASSAVNSTTSLKATPEAFSTVALSWATSSHSPA